MKKPSEPLKHGPATIIYSPPTVVAMTRLSSDCPSNAQSSRLNVTTSATTHAASAILRMTAPCRVPAGPRLARSTARARTAHPLTCGGIAQIRMSIM